MQLSTAQLYLMMSLQKRGWSEDLISCLPNRCGATEQEWADLISEGLVELVKNRYWLTREGKKRYKLERKTRTI